MRYVSRYLLIALVSAYICNLSMMAMQYIGLSTLFSVTTVMACLDGRFLAHLSPDTVTGDDGRQQPDTSNDTAEAVAEVEPVPLVLRSDTVIYDAATQRPVDELLVTFHLAYRHISVCQSLLDAASGYLVHLRSPRRCLLVPCKHIINLFRATTAVSWRPTTTR